MAALLGRLDQFDPEQEEWQQYVERLVQFFEANDITGDDKAAKRRATFLSVMGPAPYKLLRSLIAPTKPTDKTFEELVAVLTEHYSPQPPEVMQRFRFNSRSRKEGESVAAYVAELRRLAEFCNFETTLDKMLRDRLVWGIKGDSIQKKLFQEKDLTFQRALAIAQGSEAADRNLREMKAPQQELNSNSKGVTVKLCTVHKVSRRNSNTKDMGVTCHRCGTTSHLATVCRFR